MAQKSSDNHALSSTLYSPFLCLSGLFLLVIIFLFSTTFQVDIQISKKLQKSSDSEFLLKVNVSTTQTTTTSRSFTEENGNENKFKILDEIRNSLNISVIDDADDLTVPDEDDDDLTGPDEDDNDEEDEDYDEDQESESETISYRDLLKIKIAKQNLNETPAFHNITWLNNHEAHRQEISNITDTTDLTKINSWPKIPNHLTPLSIKIYTKNLKKATKKFMLERKFNDCNYENSCSLRRELMLTRYKLSSHFNVDFDDNRAANQSEFLSHERGHDVNEDGVYGLGHKVGKISEKFYEEQEKIQKFRIEKIKNFCKKPEKEKNYYGENSGKYILDFGCPKCAVH